MSAFGSEGDMPSQLGKPANDHRSLERLIRGRQLYVL